MRNKQTVINAVVKRDTRVEIKQKRERSEDFLHTNLVPKERERKAWKCKRKKMQESITHSVDFFTAIIFVFFYERATQSRHPPSAVIEKEIASKAATLNKLKEKQPK